MSNKQKKAPNFLVIANKLVGSTARMAANEAQKFFKDSFVKGGVTDSSFQRWAERNSPMGGKKVLYGQGNLMNSIRPAERSKSRVVIKSDTAYSDLHNNGGTITVTEKMKKFWWARYYELSGKVKKTKSGRVSGAKANLKVSAKAEFCKRMALMKVGTKIKMPKRQYMGQSATLMRQFDTWLKNEIEVKFNNE